MLALFLLVIPAFSVSATNITTCKGTYNIDSSGEFELIQHINNSFGTCINIDASDVMLNCSGYIINASSGMHTGIYVEDGNHNVTIKNCNVYGYSMGIHVESINSTLVNNTVWNNQYGIDFQGASNTVVENNTIFGHSIYGMYLYSKAENNSIRNNTITSNGGTNWAGISILSGNHNNITGNQIKNNTEHGIITRNGVHYTTITDNDISENYDTGLYMEYGTNNRIINNTFDNNSLSGITEVGMYLTRTNDSTIENNRANKQYVGLDLSYECYNNSVFNNTVNNNTFGIGFVEVYNNSITNNIVENNSYGIFFQLKVFNITSTNNRINNNSLQGLSILGGSNGSTFTNDSYLNNTKDIVIEDSKDCKFYNITVLPISTTFTFIEYSGDINVSRINNAPSTSPYRNISKYLNVSGTDWVVMNISYANANISNIEENSLTMMHYDGSSWTNLSSSLDKNNKDVSANLTSFSIFALLANPDCGVVNEDLMLLSNISSIDSCLIINSSNITIDCNYNNITGNKTGSSKGIHLNASKNVTVKNCYVYNFTSGIYLEKSNKSSIYNNTFSLNSNGLDIGYDSSDNIFTLNNVSYSDLFDLHMDSGTNNKFFDITMGPVSTTLSLSRYNGSLHLFGVPSPSANPAGKKNVSSYINITKTDGEYIELNISYSDDIVSNNSIDESTLKMYHYSDYNTWIELTSTVDSTNNVVYSNISNFSAFGIFGNEPTQTTPSGGGGGGGGRSSTILNVKSYNITESLVPGESFLTERLYKSDYIYFDYKNLEHRITIKEILYSNKAVKLEIASIPQEHWIYLNQDLNVDVDGNAYNDLSIRPNSISLSHTILNITILNENAPAPISFPGEPETVADKISPEQKMTELVREIFPGVSEEKASYAPIIIGILGIVIILFALFFWLKKEKIRKAVKKIPKVRQEKKPVIVPIKKTVFKPGLLKAFKDLKKRKIIKDIISSKKESAKITFAQSLPEALKKAKAKPNKKKPKKHRKKKAKRTKTKKKSKEPKPIKKLRILSKQPKQPDVFDNLQKVYSKSKKAKK